jgi:hypothetical protein
MLTKKQLSTICYCPFLLMVFIVAASGQDSAYQNPPVAEPPYYRVRYPGSSNEGELLYPVSYTLWIPPNVRNLRGVVVHQHGCGEGSCRSGQTGAWDLHWQALARKHDCALLSPVYEQPEKEDCTRWCDPRKGSDLAFQRGLKDLGLLSNHPELSSAPWILWGHSGGGHWVGGMTFLHPERVVAAWLRSGVPPLQPSEGRPDPWTIHDGSLSVPILCNLGTKEGVTQKDGRFARVWSGIETFFREMRKRGALIGIAVDPLSSHECGNQRYLAIPWLDYCMQKRLQPSSHVLTQMPSDEAWLAPMFSEDPTTSVAVPRSRFQGNIEESTWLPDETIAKLWMQYIRDTKVMDTTPPPRPKVIRIDGNTITWQAEADLESGIASFVVIRDGLEIATIPTQGKNPFGRPIFQNNSYSDTPTQPLVEMKYIDTTANPAATHNYAVVTINTSGMRSEHP